MLTRVLSPALGAVRGLVTIYMRARRRQLVSELSHVQKQDPACSSIVDEQLSREEQDLLRKILRRFPYWVTGHLELGRAALGIDDVRTAYASALAARKLARTGPAASGASKLIALCHLRRGDAREARALLEEIVAADPLDSEAKEDLAACHLALGEDALAESILGSIPKERRSPEAAEALRYARSKDRPRS